MTIDKANALSRGLIHLGVQPNDKIAIISMTNRTEWNICDIGIGFQDDVFIAVIAIDNLGKGASGQAIQNMNLMQGFEETEGLL